MNDILNVDDLKFLEINPRKHGERNLSMIEDSLREVGAARSIVIDENDVILAGNGTVTSAPGAGISRVKVVEADGDEIIAVRRRNLTEEQKKRLSILDNSTAESAEWDTEALQKLIAEGIAVDDIWDDEQLKEIFDADSLQTREGAAKPVEEARQTLAQRFGVPPFSVLDARQGYWQARKNAWLAMGLRSFEGREQGLTYDGAGAKPPSFYMLRNEMRDLAGGVDPSWDEINAEAMRRGMMSAAIEGTSIFDPVLAELCYRWFCPPEGVILDPFAGGSVRGLVAAQLFRSYIGIDLSAQQIEANQDGWRIWPPTSGIPEPCWLQGDSTNRDTFGSVPAQVDFVFSCPPYADLEVYSNDARDLSNMKYEDFLSGYRAAIAHSIGLLKPDRFACFVVGDVRDKRGNYHGFVADTIRAFEDAGANFYNDAVLVTQIGSGAVRAGRQFENSRKLCKTHQNILVFVKGDAKRATEAIGTCEWSEIIKSDDEKTALEEDGL